jgi:hypothetical protein
LYGKASRKNKKQKNLDGFKDKETRMKQIEAELERGYKKIDERTHQNERLSSELKQLKEMLPVKNTGLNMSVVIEDKNEINKDLVEKDKDIDSIKKRYEGEELSDDSEPMPVPKRKGSSDDNIDENKSEDSDNVMNKSKDIVSPSNTIGL